MQIDDCRQRALGMLGPDQAQRNPCLRGASILSPVFQLLHMKVCTLCFLTAPTMLLHLSPSTNCASMRGTHACEELSSWAVYAHSRQDTAMLKQDQRSSPITHPFEAQH